MCLNRILVLCYCALGLALMSTSSRAVTLTARAVAVDDVPIAETSAVTIDPGQTVTVVFYYSGWENDVPGSTLHTYQVGLEGFHSYLSGSTGRLIPLGWDAQWPTSCSEPGACPAATPLCDTLSGTCNCLSGVGTCPAPFVTCSGGLCVGGSHDTAQGVFIETERDDFAYSGLEFVAAVRTPQGNLSPAWGATVLSDSGPGDVGQSAYAGTHIVQASDDACGTFTFSYGTFLGTFVILRDGGIAMPGLELAPDVIDTVSVTVDHDGPCDPSPVKLLGPRRLDGSLARVRLNPIALNFDGVIELPNTDELAVMELTPDVCAGSVGPSVSGLLTLVVDPNIDPNRLVIIDQEAATYETGRWYRIANSGAWPGVEQFEVDFRVLVGDANGDGFVNFADLAEINQSIPTLPAGIDASNRNRDVNADGFINFADMTTTVGVIPKTSAPYPCP